MDTMDAFMRGEAARRVGAKLKTFDWDKAADIIVERGVKNASAGLSEDWEWTGGPILKDGIPIPVEETYVYLTSNWATPELDVGGQLIDCWKYLEEGGEEEYWPESAREKLGV